MSELEEILLALSDRRRRRILRSLREENRIDVFGKDRTEQERSIQLQHVHLPRLEETDLVEWDRDADVVKRGTDFEAVEPVLTAIENQRETLVEDHPQREEQKTW